MPVIAHDQNEVVYRVRMSKRHRADLNKLTHVLHERGMLHRHGKGHLAAKDAIEIVIEVAKRALGVA